MNQDEAFWVVVTCSVVGYHRFRGPCCLRLHPKEDLNLKHHHCESLKTHMSVNVCYV